MGIRVTNTSSFRHLNGSINDTHARVNKSMNKVASGKAYETADENPLAYNQGKKIDSQYLDIQAKLSLTTNITNRIEEQTRGALSIQSSLDTARTAAIHINSQDHYNEASTVETKRAEMLQQQQAIANDLNRQFGNLYVFGGNDILNAPFSVSADGSEMTFTHQFAGDDNPSTMTMKLEYDPALDNGLGGFKYEFSGTDGNKAPTDEVATLDNLLKAMKEQGRVDIGYGTINDKNTLLDTYTGGLNLLTGLNSQSLKDMGKDEAKDLIVKRLNDSPVGLIGQAVMAMNKFTNEKNADGTTNTDFENADKYTERMGKLIDKMTNTGDVIGTVYADLGNKSKLIATTETKMEALSDALTEQYTDLLGADPYESIMEMYSHQYSYQAAQKVSSQLLQSSLFDFMR